MPVELLRWDVPLGCCSCPPPRGLPCARGHHRSSRHVGLVRCVTACHAPRDRRRARAATVYRTLELVLHERGVLRSTRTWRAARARADACVHALAAVARAAGPGPEIRGGRRILGLVLEGVKFIFCAVTFAYVRPAWGLSRRDQETVRPPSKVS